MCTEHFVIIGIFADQREERILLFDQFGRIAEDTSRTGNRRTRDACVSTSRIHSIERNSLAYAFHSDRDRCPSLLADSQEESWREQRNTWQLNTADERDEARGDEDYTVRDIEELDLIVAIVQMPLTDDPRTANIGIFIQRVIRFVR